MYDEQGHFLGEYDAHGKPLQETIYLGDLPVAVIKPGASGPAVYYVYADHLQAPRVLTRAVDNQMVWRWDQADPFGMMPPDENPSGLGMFSYDLRFPGQVFDRETNNHYNYFRDYDPQTGRYIESDPIGLNGGINTYSYVGGDPLSLIDPKGLAAPGGQNAGHLPKDTSKGDCPDGQCKHTITIHTGGVCPPGDTMCPQAMKAAGIQPPYGYTTLRLDIVCLAKLGIGVKGTAAVGGTLVGKYAPGIAAKGASAVGVPIEASILGAIQFLANECTCKEGR